MFSLSNETWPDAQLKDESLPRKLIGLTPYSSNRNIGSLLLCNRGSQLRQLVWQGHDDEMKTEHQDALKSLRCLEELHLDRWTVSNELLYEVLDNCSWTLKALGLAGVGGFDQGLFDHFNNVRGQPDSSSTGMTPRSFPRLKSLVLVLDDRQSVAALRLLRHCPALESISISVTSRRHSISNFTSELRKHCHNLQDIKLRTYAFSEYGQYISSPEMEALLFKDGCELRGLRRASMTSPRGVDNFMRDALLFHGDTLVTLEIECPFYFGYRGDRIFDDVRNVACLLGRCRNLKQVQLLGFGHGVPSLIKLLASPWGCQGLEYLTIEYRPSYLFYSEITPKLQRLESERRHIRQCAWPRKLRHHEYRDDGQGWFLKPGLTRTKFIDALIDGDWKRSVFEHMYKKSGIRKAKYIRLKDTEFFAQEQHFNDTEAERKELMEEEGFVVNYGVLIPRGLNTRSMLVTVALMVFAGVIIFSQLGSLHNRLVQFLSIYPPLLSLPF
ncbi:hypothetical protein BGX31_007648 [Mortierella sp. GBA43]|nr:hypothetical protein BGX31_007648 [Mortierella sp. GBA43]